MKTIINERIGSGNPGMTYWEECPMCGDMVDDPDHGSYCWADDDPPQCEGHESLSGADMGQTVYCDGSCRD